MKSFLVYGGSGYVGSAIVKKLLSEGHRVFSTFNTHALEPLSSNHFVYKCDIKSDLELKRLSQEISKVTQSLDGVVSAVASDAAHLFGLESSFDLDAKEWQEIISFYGKDIPRSIIAHINHLKTSKSGNIIFIGSLVGNKSVTTPIQIAAGMTSIKGVMDSLSRDLGKYNICVNSIDPGILKEGQSRHFPQRLKDSYLKHCSLKRYGNAQEVAEVVHWFLNENTFITGKNILLDGGL